VARAPDETGTLKDSYMFTKTCERHRKRLGNVGNTGRTERETLKNGATRGIRNGGGYEIEGASH
jgi:hypothetical protein